MSLPQKETKRGKLISFNVIFVSFALVRNQIGEVVIFIRYVRFYLSICNKRNKCNFLLAHHVYSYIAPFPITLYIHDIT